MISGLAFPKKRTPLLPPPKPRRRAAKEREVLDVIFRQGARIPCGCGCGAPLSRSNLARDHTHALELGGADEAENWRYILKVPCHAAKTFGIGRATSAGSDLHLIAKGKRLRGETCVKPKLKIKSRGFQTNRGGKFKLPLGSNAVLRATKEMSKKNPTHLLKGR